MRAETRLRYLTMGRACRCVDRKTERRSRWRCRTRCRLIDVAHASPQIRYRRSSSPDITPGSDPLSARLVGRSVTREGLWADFKGASCHGSMQPAAPEACECTAGRCGLPLIGPSVGGPPRANSAPILIEDPRGFRGSLASGSRGSTRALARQRDDNFSTPRVCSCTLQHG